MAISKFNVDGSELLFATYLGGSGNETPHSLVVDESDNLYLLGATSSNNFPTSNGCLDNSFNGGLPKIHEHDDKAPQGLGLIFEGRLVCFYDYECDLGDGWEDANVHNDPKDIRLKALKMGANIIKYAFEN